MAFPLDVRADDATCGIQFGAVRRPTHPSSSWDAAKFEVCAHRYVDVAEPSFGVAVLNDGRYGHARVRRRRPGEPGARRPLPRSRCRPGSPPRDAQPVPARPRAGRRGRRGRAPRPAVAAGGRRPGRGRAAHRSSSVTGRGVEVDAVKVADDGSGDIVVRLHEAVGDRAAVTVGRGRPDHRGQSLQPARGAERWLRGQRRHRGHDAAPLRAGDAPPHALNPRQDGWMRRRCGSL